MRGKLDMNAARDAGSASRSAAGAAADLSARPCASAPLSRRGFCVGATAALAAGVSALLGVEAPRMALAEDAAASDGQAVPATAGTQALAAQVPASLPSWVDERTAQTLLSLAGDPTVDVILSDAQALGELGENLAAKLLKLAADDPAARDFVARFRQSYPGTKAEGLTSEDLEQGGIPRLMQWDERWGYMEYIGGPMGTKGCCPTCLAMLYAGYSGRTDMSPYLVSLLASESGLCDPELGTHGEFVGYFCQRVGLEYAEIADVDTAAACLDDGWCLVCNLGAGEFTEVGHYMLVTGWADADGNVEVRDPYTSSVNENAWPLAEVLFECNSIYAVRAGTVQQVPGA